MERGQRDASSVEMEAGFVEVDLQVLRGHPVMGALQLGLEVGDRSVHPGQDVVGVLARASGSHLVAWLVVVSRPAVGVHRGARSDVLGDHCAQIRRRGTLDDPHAHPPRSVAAGLDGNDYKGSGAPLTSAAQPSLVSTHETLINVHVTGDRFTRLVDHGPAQLCSIIQAVSWRLMPSWRLQLHVEIPGDDVAMR